ncbi:hypothetical protein NL676_009347 [Syzygium grande]|nr:hypothetical protein NL676_009347 [Syzygium grande]
MERSKIFMGKSWRWILQILSQQEGQGSLLTICDPNITALLQLRHCSWGTIIAHFSATFGIDLRSSQDQIQKASDTVNVQRCVPGSLESRRH